MEMPIFLTHTEKLQRYRNRIFKKMTRPTSLRKLETEQLHDIFELPTITDFIEKRHTKFFGLNKITNKPL